MTPNRRIYAAIFVAAFAIPTWSAAEDVYKCGSTYSQTPCPDGKLLNIDDARDPTQKKQIDAATRSDAKLGSALEKERLTQERDVQPTPLPSGVKAKAKAKGAATTAPSPTILTPKRIKPKPYKPQAFTALIPGSGKTPAKIKKNQKKKPPVALQ